MLGSGKIAWYSLGRSCHIRLGRTLGTIVRKREKIASLRPKILSHRDMATRPREGHATSLGSFFCSDYKHRNRFSGQERPARKTESSTETGLQGKVRGIVLGFLRGGRGVQGCWQQDNASLVYRGYWPGSGSSREQAGLGMWMPARVQLSLGPGPETSPVKQRIAQPPRK